jgi:hypothetical protein
LTVAAGAKTVNVHITDGTVVNDPSADVSYIDFTAKENPAPQSQPSTAPKGVVAVDLGLPSGTKWANMNVGATRPEEYGLYFAWGETTGYTSDTSDGRLFKWTNYKWCNHRIYLMTKYCTDSKKGTIDNKTVLDLEDDAAHVNWGGSWVMPTSGEIDELLANTTSEWTTVNGIKGCKFTSKTNGNSIFLPAAGRSTSHLRKGRSPLIGDIAGTEEYQQVTGCYWSASLDGKRPYFAMSLYFSQGYKNVTRELRFFQFPVRAVIRK